MEKNLSMVDCAYEILTKKKKAMDFYKLYDEVSKAKGYDSDHKAEQQSLFYTNITLDGRFITLGENEWDLRTRHKFEDVNIDMNAIYADDEESDDSDDDDSVEEDNYNE